MVTVNARQSANDINNVLQERNIQGLAVVALSAAGGVVVAQEVADRILPLIGQSRNPSGLTGFATSAGVKGAVALGFGILATNLSGIGLVAAAYMAVGALAGAGADLLNAVQRSGLAAESPRSSSSSSSSSNSNTSRSPSAMNGAARGQVSV